jgi:hypothetical protein
MDKTRLNQLRTALDKARTTEAVARALLIVAQSDYEWARDARIRCAANLDAEWRGIQQSRTKAA